MCHGFAPVHTHPQRERAAARPPGFAKLVDGKLVPSPELRVVDRSAARRRSTCARARRRSTAARLEAALRAELDRRYRGLVELRAGLRARGDGRLPGRRARRSPRAEGYMLGGARHAARSAAVRESPWHARRPADAARDGDGLHRRRARRAARRRAAARAPARRGADRSRALLGLRLESALGLPIVGLFDAGPGRRAARAGGRRRALTRRARVTRRRAASRARAGGAGACRRAVGREPQARQPPRERRGSPPGSRAARATRRGSSARPCRSCGGRCPVALEVEAVRVRVALGIAVHGAPDEHHGIALADRPAVRTGCRGRRTSS